MIRTARNQLIRLLAKMVKPSIVFESIPDFSDNSRAVYDEMVRRGYGEKYNLVWYVDTDKCVSISDGRQEDWASNEKGIISRFLMRLSIYHNTKCIICCNRFIGSSGPRMITHGDGQVSFYLSHGTPMKSVRSYYTSPGGIDYILSPSKAIDSVMAEEFSFDAEQVFTAGFPRNDVFSKSSIDLNGKLGENFDKIIVWYPTYRQNTNNSVVTGEFALPIIHDQEKALQLNETAKQNNTLIILKMHYVQDISKIHDLHLSNIWFIDDHFFDEFGLTSYELLAGSDALITDYSSVYFDYTLHDKPIGVIWEDIEEYSKFPGFALDLSYYLKGAEKIYCIEELCSFIVDIANNKDWLRVERQEIRDMTNISTDGKNAERVVDFIVEKAAL